MHPEFLSQPTDEVLETVWRRQEAGVTSLAGLLALPEHRGDAELVDEMAATGLVHRNGDRITLTPAGEARARSVVRCHRLAERLLHDVLPRPTICDLLIADCVVVANLLIAGSFVHHKARLPDPSDY